jgi:tetratricopeptide (TPR) repeat protein
LTTTHDPKQLASMGHEALRDGDTAHALECFAQLVKIDRSPATFSHFAYCLAKERREFQRAITLCHESVRSEPKNPQHYFHLGRIYLLADRKKDAIRAFQVGLRYGRSREIEVELRRLGSRRAPPLPFLGRENPVNKFLGIFLKRLRLR